MTPPLVSNNSSSRPPSNSFVSFAFTEHVAWEAIVKALAPFDLGLLPRGASELNGAGCLGDGEMQDVIC